MLFYQYGCWWWKQRSLYWQTWIIFEFLSWQVRFHKISEWWYRIRVFEIGETLFLTNDGWSGFVKVKYFPLDEVIILKIVLKIPMEKILSLPRNIFVHHPILTLDGFLSLHHNTDKLPRFPRKKQSKILPHQHTCHHCNKICFVYITNLTTSHSQSCYG